MQKGQALIFVLVGILVIAGIAGGAYYLGRQATPKPSPAPVVSQSPQPTSDETVYTEATRSATWKTYTSSDNKYTFQYPSYCDITIEEVGVVQVMCKKTNYKYNKDDIGLFLIITSLSDKSLENTDLYMQNYSQINTDFTQIKFNNEDAIRSVYPGSFQGGGSHLDIFLIHNNQGYLLSTTYPALSNAKNITQFPSPKPDILSTFKFLQ